MRAALGASRERLVRQLMVEIFFLAALGAGGGLLLARWAVDGLLALMAGPTTPVEVGLDGTVFLFTLAVTLAAATLSGLAPAMFTTRADLVAALKTRFMPAPDRGTSGPLVVCQIAVCLVLVVGASLLARSLQALERQDIGFHADDVLVSRIYPRMVGYEPERVGELYRRLQERLAALPGVRSVTIARYSPFSGTSSRNSGSVEEYTPRSGEDVTLETIQVGASYPETLGIPLVLGRAIGPLDATGGARVGMVNQAFVRRYLPDGNPLGRRFSIGGEVPDTEIVGVVGDVQFHNVRDEVEPMVFVPWLAAYGQFVLDAEVAVRTTTHGGATPEDIRRAIRDVDGSLPLEGPRPLYNQIANSFQIERLFARFVGAFSALALVLACVGLCGLVTQGVSRRTQEIGLRMALGAQRRQILWMILRRALRLVAVGLLIGVPAAFGASQLLASVLFGVTPADPASFVLGVTALGSVGTMAVLIPACRAARVDPLVALRSE
jgi:predicted permease